MGHPSQHDHRAAVPSALVSDIDSILRDHGLEMPKSDITAALAWLLAGHYGDPIGAES